MFLLIFRFGDCRVFDGGFLFHKKLVVVLKAEIILNERTQEGTNNLCCFANACGELKIKHAPTCITLSMIGEFEKLLLQTEMYSLIYYKSLS